MKVRFIKEKEIKKEKTVLDVAKKLGVDIDHSCKGKGKCGKCLIRVISGDVSELSKAEKKLLSEKKIKKGYRLACETIVNGDVDIEII